MRQKAKLLAAGWDRYRSRVIPISTSDEHLKQCRRSFYAGAHLLMTDILELLDHGDDSTPTQEDLMMMEDLQDELIEFAVSVVQGQA